MRHREATKGDNGPRRREKQTEPRMNQELSNTWYKTTSLTSRSFLLFTDVWRIAKKKEWLVDRFSREERAKLWC